MKNLSSLGAIARLLGEARNGDLFPHRATHLEVFGNLVQVASKLIGGRRAVECGVIPHRPEPWLLVVLELAIFAEAVSIERALAYGRLSSWPCQPSYVQVDVPKDTSGETGMAASVWLPDSSLNGCVLNGSLTSG